MPSRKDHSRYWRGAHNSVQQSKMQIVNGQIINFKYKNFDFTVPHKQLTYRNFVLYPLKEILPDWKHPKTKESIDSLIQKLSDDDRKSILKVKKN